MKVDAAVLEKPATSDSFAADHPVEIEPVELDSPTGSQVLVEIGAASLCHTDISIVKGEVEEQYPLVMGHEGAGYVREVGEDVDSLEPGDHVALGRPSCGSCRYCRHGDSQICPTRWEIQRNGTLRGGSVEFSRGGEQLYHCHSVSSFSSHTIVTEEVAVKINDDVPMREATLLGCGVPTGIGAVTNSARVESGSSVAIFGVGGVGLNAVQGARMCSALDIIAVDSVQSKLDLACNLGATHTVDITETNPIDRIAEITDDGVDYSFEMVGNARVVEQCVEALSPTGTAILVGVPPVGSQSLELDMYDFILSEKRVRGAINGSYNLPIAMSTLADQVANGTISLDPLITATRSIDDLNEAIDDLEGGEQIRQVIYP